MVACKFFQQGNCRFGQNCRFDHIYDRSKYSYHAPTSQPVTNTSSGTDEQLVNQVQSDVQSALRGGQWLLSCYSPFKEKPIFPGISDLSMEEARLFIYEAKSNNNLDQAMTYMNNLFKESRQKYEQLLQPNAMIIKVLRSLYRGEMVPSPFGNNGGNQGFGNQSSASSVFQSAVQTSSIFSQNTGTTNSIFGQSQTPSNASVFGQNNGFGSSSPSSVFEQKPTNVFGSANPENAAKSIFAQANQNLFRSSPSNQNMFGVSKQSNMFDKPDVKADSTPMSIFAQSSQNTYGVNQAQNQLDSNPSNLFGNASQSAFGVSVFTPQLSAPFSNQSSISPFSNANQNVFQSSQGLNPEDHSIYSDINNIAADDLEAFKAEYFKLGFIPEIAPPHSLSI